MYGFSGRSDVDTVSIQNSRGDIFILPIKVSLTVLEEKGDKFCDTSTPGFIAINHSRKIIEYFLGNPVATYNERTTHTFSNFDPRRFSCFVLVYSELIKPEFGYRIIVVCLCPISPGVIAVPQGPEGRNLV